MAQVDADADAIPVDGGPPGHDAGDGDRQPPRRGTAGAARPRRGYHMERFNDLFSFQTGKTNLGNILKRSEKETI